jgi:hypothetical protein
MKSGKPGPKRRSTVNKQERVATLLASGVSVRAAAKDAGVAESTVYEWQQNDPEFPRLVAKYRARLIERTLGKLSAVAARAVRTLSDCLKEPTADPVRVRAAAVILERLVAIREHQDLAERLAELEAKVGDRP